MKHFRIKFKYIRAVYIAGIVFSFEFLCNCIWFDNKAYGFLLNSVVSNVAYGPAGERTRSQFTEFGIFTVICLIRVFNRLLSLSPIIAASNYECV